MWGTQLPTGLGFAWDSPARLSCAVRLSSSAGGGVQSGPRGCDWMGAGPGSFWEDVSSSFSWHTKAQVQDPAHPRAVVMLPFSPLWACCFFLMVVLLGLDSQFVCVESLVTALVDLNPRLLRRKNRREVLILGVSVASFLPGLLMLTEGGMYVFQLFDYYAASGMCLLFVAVFESLCVAWVYGAGRFYEDIEDMIGYRPCALIQYCWLFLTPAVCTATFLSALVKYAPLTYNKKYRYPWWGDGLGWLLALASMLCIPACGLYKLATRTGALRERLQELVRPADDLPRRVRAPAQMPRPAPQMPLLRLTEVESHC